MVIIEPAVPSAHHHHHHHHHYHQPTTTTTTTTTIIIIVIITITTTFFSSSLSSLSLPSSPAHLSLSPPIELSTHPSNHPAEATTSSIPAQLASYQCTLKSQLDHGKKTYHILPVSVFRRRRWRM